MTDAVKELITQIRQIAHEPMWSVADIADYLQMSETSVRRCIVSKDDFPASIRVPYGSRKTQPRWYPQEVKEWVKQFRCRG